MISQSLRPHAAAAQRGFTLIELLVVVSLIAILSAIALPNFLEAQTRAKVSRVKADLRTVATALEIYATDTAHYPPVTFLPTTGQWLPTDHFKLLPSSLTTPLAYLTSTQAQNDMFRYNRDGGGACGESSELSNKFMYLPSAFYQPPYAADETAYEIQAARYGAWMLRSAGPDRYYQNDPGVAADYGDGGWNAASYDPTNGSVSTGDIYRSQRSASEYHV